MRALKHLKNRFEWAIKYNKPIYPNDEDLHCLNELIDFCNGNKPKDSELEDALMLFFILQNWRIENQNNEKLIAVYEPTEFITLTNASVLLQKLSLMLSPKKNIINEIWHELRLNQFINKTPSEKKIKRKQVEEFLEKILKDCKERFPIIRELANGVNEFTYELGENKPTATENIA